MANQISYFLEIYEPNSTDTCLFSATSENPFPKFVKGDVLNTAGYKGQNGNDLNLIVDKVEYIVWEVSIFSIKTLIYTKEMGN